MVMIPGQLTKKQRAKLKGYGKADRQLTHDDSNPQFSVPVWQVSNAARSVRRKLLKGSLKSFFTSKKTKII